jgi:hypothetical protein
MKTGRRVTGASKLDARTVANSQVGGASAIPQSGVLTVGSARNECDTPQAQATTAQRRCRRDADIEQFEYDGCSGPSGPP